MRINALGSNYGSNIRPSHKAIVKTVEKDIPQRPNDDGDKVKQVCKELERKLKPIGDDNLLIVLKAGGYRADRNKYYNILEAHMGYKDIEVARKKILEQQRGLDPDERLDDRFIRQLENADSEVMQKLSQSHIRKSSSYINEDIGCLKNDLFEQVEFEAEYLGEDLVNPSTLAAPTAEQLQRRDEIQKDNELSKFRYWLKHCLDGAPPPIV